MTKEEFIERYGRIYEHSPWIAGQVWEKRLQPSQDSIAELAREMKEVVAAAGLDRQLELIRAHPDLAGRAAVRGELTTESKNEQASVGIDQCSPEEFDRFQCYNKAYKAKFQFPFVMAVKGSDRANILEAFEQRLRSDYETEFRRALMEIHQIARLRLQALSGEKLTPAEEGQVGRRPQGRRSRRDQA